MWKIPVKMSPYYLILSAKGSSTYHIWFWKVPYPYRITIFFLRNSTNFFNFSKTYFNTTNNHISFIFKHIVIKLYFTSLKIITKKIIRAIMNPRANVPWGKWLVGHMVVGQKYLWGKWSWGKSTFGAHDRRAKVPVGQVIMVQM